MSNYTKTTNFAAKDSLPSGNAAKIVKGTEIDTEFNNIATASATKANANNAALTGTTVFETLSDGTLSITGWVDEDNMSSDSASLVPTQQSVKAYVDSQVTAQDLDVTDGSTSIDIDLDSESLGILGGTGIDSTASGTGVTLAIDATVATLAGTQTLSNKTLSTPVVSGNLTTDGLIDGRDVATDGTKLDGIESGATADQTAAEIKTAYESNADTNAFTDADHSKLDGIEASADVTDTTNVTAAGALMDSELTSEASVKAMNQGVATTDSPTFAGVTAPVTGNVTGNLTGNVTGNVTGDLTGDVTGNVAGNLTGSVLTAAQTNITSVGTLGSLTVSGDVTVDTNSLKVDSTNNRVGILNASPDVSLDIGSATDAMHVPVGTTAQRPGSPAAGYFRYNSTTGGFEGYTDAWGAIAGGGGGVAPSIDTMTGDGSDTTLALTNAPVNENATFVTIDGVTQHKSTYSVSGTTLTFSTAPPTGSAVEAITLNTTTINTASILQDADGDTKVQVEESSDEDKIRFDTAGTERVIIDSTGVGIGTSSPNESLHVYHATNNVLVNIESGDAKAFISFKDNSTTNTDTVFLGADGNNMAFYAGSAGTERMRITSAGNVGIGTGSPATNLHIQSASEPAITLFHTGIMASQIGLDSTGSLTFGIDGSTGATERLRITSAGLVGIGTSSPSTALHVDSGTANTVATFTSTDAYALIKFEDNDTTTETTLGALDNDMVFRVGAAERMRIDSAGNVGIGTSSPSQNLSVHSSTGGNAYIDVTRDNATSTTLRLGAENGSTVINSIGAVPLAFYTNSAERMRIDSSGNLLVGRTSNFSGAKAEIQTSDNVTTLTLNKNNTNDGEILRIAKSGTTVGSIGALSGGIYIGDSDVGLQFDGAADAVRPCNTNTPALSDNFIDLGSSSVRFDNIYATNGTIQTSDRNEKQDIEALSEAEQRVAVAAKGLLRKFRWKDSVTEKGDDARIHFGIIAQDLQDAFTAEGLDAGRYAMFISSTWTDEDTGEERSRMGVRYSELLAFIISAI